MNTSQKAKVLAVAVDFVFANGFNRDELKKKLK